MLQLHPNKERSVRRFANTSVVTEPHSAYIRLHSTNIVVITKVHDGYSVTLNAGGWRKATTKKRMNEVAEEFGLDFHVWQHKGSWLVSINPHGSQWEHQPKPFTDGMTFTCEERD